MHDNCTPFVILSAAKNLCAASEILRYAQDDNRLSLMVGKNLININDLVGPVILRCAQNLGVASEILRCAQNDSAEVD